MKTIQWCGLLLSPTLVAGIQSILPPISECITTMLLFDRDADRWLIRTELQEVLSRMYGCPIDDSDTSELYESIQCVCHLYGGSEGCCDEGIALAGKYPEGYLNDVCNAIIQYGANKELRRGECGESTSSIENDGNSIAPGVSGGDDGRFVRAIVLIVGISTLTTILLFLFISKRRKQPETEDPCQLPSVHPPLSPLELLRESSGTPLGILRPTDIPMGYTFDAPIIPVMIETAASGSFSPGNPNSIQLDSPRPATIAEVSYESSSMEDLTFED